MAEEEGALSGEIGQIGLPSRDIARSVGFYRDALGLKLIFQLEKMAFFACSGLRLMLAIPEKPDFEKPGAVLYFRVADIARAHAILEQRGVAFMGEPHMVADMGDHELWMAFFADPDENPLALMCERAK